MDENPELDAGDNRPEIYCEATVQFPKVSQSEVNVNIDGIVYTPEDMDADGGRCIVIKPIPWVVLNGQQNWPDGPYDVKLSLVGDCPACPFTSNDYNKVPGDFLPFVPDSDYLDGGAVPYLSEAKTSGYCESSISLGVSLPQLPPFTWSPSCLPDGGFFY